MFKPRLFIAGISALLMLATVLVPSPASADVWPGVPSPNGPRSGSPTGSTTTVECRNGTGVQRGVLIFDTHYYGCEESESFGVQILFDGFEVWRFYGTKDNNTDETLSLQWGSASRMPAPKFGNPWPFGYSFYAPHPVDNNSHPNNFGKVPGTFLTQFKHTEQGEWAAINPQFQQVPSTTFHRFGSGDCRTLTNDRMNNFVAANNQSALAVIQERYMKTVQRGYHPTVAATMANIKRPPSNPNNLQEYRALWDDGVPCSSTLEYTADKHAATSPQVVTCWIPTERRGKVYRGGNSPYTRGLTWRDGLVRYSDFYPIRGDYLVQRFQMFMQKLGMGSREPFQPYIKSNPLALVDNSTFAAAFTLAMRADCRDTTAGNEDVASLTVTDKATSPPGQVTVSLDTPEVLQVGGASKPSVFKTSTKLHCSTSNCKPAGRNDVPATVLLSSSHKLGLSGTNGYKKCATSQAPNCDFFIKSQPAAGSSLSLTAWFFRATDPDQRIVSTMSDVQARVRRFEVVRTFECPFNYGGDLSKCTQTSRDTRPFTENASVTLKNAPTTQSVVSATNNPSGHR